MELEEEIVRSIETIIYSSEDLTAHAGGGYVDEIERMRCDRLLMEIDWRNCGWPDAYARIHLVLTRRCMMATLRTQHRDVRRCVQQRANRYNGFAKWVLLQ